ncbi:MAG: hypothetical protein Q7S22_04595 [Candidatus Micrarchaeota archaeon]|nr:hypothetical protein [Candidatus Micrarchaeota archaeon]
MYQFCVPDPREGATCGSLEPATRPSGGNPPYSFVMGYNAGVLPPGLRLNLNGKLEGMPTLAGNYPVEICAKDAYGNGDCDTITIEVKNANIQAPSYKITVKAEYKRPQLEDDITYESATWEISETEVQIKQKEMFTNEFTGTANVLIKSKGIVTENARGAGSFEAMQVWCSRSGNYQTEFNNKIRIRYVAPDPNTYEKPGLRVSFETDDDWNFVDEPDYEDQTDDDRCLTQDYLIYRAAHLLDDGWWVLDTSVMNALLQGEENGIYFDNVDGGTITKQIKIGSATNTVTLTVKRIN